jgi:hypothetical protein
VGSYLSPDELLLIQRLPQDAPYAINNVRCSIFSLALHYGGITFRGRGYEYMPATDELVREDVVRYVTKLRKLQAKAKKADAPKTQELF